MQDSAMTANDAPSQKVRRMAGLSLHGWENVMLASLALAAVFAALVGVATYCVVQLQRAEIAEAKEESERYKLDVERKISEADARAAEAKLELAKFKEPRSISAAQAETMSREMLPFSGTTFEFASANESEPLSVVDAVENALIKAGWVVRGTSNIIFISRANRTSVALAAETGVSVQSFSENQKETAAARALAQCLSEIGIAARFEWANPANTPKQATPAILIAVGKKP